MFLVCFVFGFLAFTFASNILNEFWQWLVAGIATFVITAIALKFELMGLFLTVLGILVLTMIYLYIVRFTNKH